MNVHTALVGMPVCNLHLQRLRTAVRLHRSLIAVSWSFSSPTRSVHVAHALQSRSQSSNPQTSNGKKPSFHRSKPAYPVRKVHIKGVDAEGEFFAPAGITFSSLGLLKEVAESIERAGFLHPSRLQELAIPQLLTGRNLVLAAETGSGKTLTYLAAAATQLLKDRQLPDESEPIEQLSRRATTKKGFAVVLCPNSTLCGQVVSMAAALKLPDGTQLLKAAQVSNAMPPPFEPLDIVVSTPGALWSLIIDAGRHYGWAWTPEGLAAHCRHLVVDEADLLTVGSYEKDLQRILDLFKVEERRTMEEQLVWQLKLPEEGFDRLSRNLKKACWDGGLEAMREEGYVASISPRPLPAGAYRKRQHIFVAATMPDLTKGDVGTSLRKTFPDALWLQGPGLHKTPAKVEHTWVKVEDDDDRLQALLRAIRDDADRTSGTAKVLVFVKGGPAAEEVAKDLQENGILARAYHKGLPMPERTEALELFASSVDGNTSPASEQPSTSERTGAGSSGSSHVVLVSTDASARGMDIPDITHVIQADFASNAVDFLHRVGRTARAGKTGKATNLYYNDDEIRVTALMDHINQGLPIEACFSRNRSLTRKVKKYGKFVARGERGEVAPVVGQT